jgi:TrmH family RNA methyltransferase
MAQRAATTGASTAGSGAALRITSRENPRVRQLMRLTGSSRARRVQGVALLEGIHLVEAIAENGLSAELLCASDGGLRQPHSARLFESCPSGHRIVVPDRLFEEISSLASPTGILAVVPVPDPGPLPDVLEDAVVLEGIQDSGNVGTILRTAAATGIQRVIACAGTAFVWSPKVLRAAMGAHFHLSLYERDSVAAAIPGAAGSIVATASRGSASVFDLDLRGPTVWIFGSEGGGLSAEALATARVTAHIPMASGVESLNVAVCAAVCLFEQHRQRTAGPKIRGVPV